MKLERLLRDVPMAASGGLTTTTTTTTTGGVRGQRSVERERAGVAIDAPPAYGDVKRG